MINYSPLSTTCTLTVGGDSTLAGDVTIGALTSGGTAQLVVNQEGGVAPVAKFMSRTNKAIIQISDNDTTGYLSSENGLLSLGRNAGVNATNININASHNVGIGTSNPTAAKLVVDSDTAPQILVKNSGGNNAQILFEDNSGGTQNASITFDQASQNTLTIATGYQSPTDLNRINIAPAGNVGLTVRGGTGGSGLGQPLVGIGTTSPDSPLEIQFVEANGTSKEMLHLDYNPTDNYGSAIFKISSGASANDIFEIEQVTGGGNGDFGTYLDTNIINRNVSSGAYGNINFVTGSSTSASSIVMTIGGGTQKGNVGIGTTTPVAPLHIVTPAVAGVDLTDISRTANNLVRFTNPQYSTSATMGLLLRVFPDSDARQGAGLLMTGGSDNAASNLSLFVSKDDGSGNNISKSYSALHIAGNTGNVGIGTTSPDSKLDVKGTSATPADGNQTLSITNSTGGTQLNLGTAENSYGWIEAREGSTLRNLLINPNGGNVGIGTTSPNPFSWGTRHLTVQSAGTSTYAAIDIIGSGSGAGALLFGGGSGSGTATNIGRAQISALDGSHLAFYTNASNSGASFNERMRFVL